MSPSLQSAIGVPDRGAGRQNYDSDPGLGGVCDYGSSAADLGRDVAKPPLSAELASLRRVAGWP